MRKVIEAIRGVVGVSGVVLLERATNSFHKLLPARAEHKVAEQLSNRLMEFAQTCDEDRSLIARFKKGWLFLYNHHDFALLVIGKSDLNTTTLNLVLKSAVSSLGTTVRQSVTAKIQLVKFDAEHAACLTRAINLSLAFFQGQLSRFEIADLLRLAKAQLIEEFPSLKQFTVDANGGVILIKGAEKNMDTSAVFASARLIATFVDLVKSKTTTIGFDIERITAQLQPALGEIGFYVCFRDFHSMKTK